jgi:ribonuclease VapC
VQLKHTQRQRSYRREDARAHAPEPFTLEHAIDAHSAYLHYGKGRHPAAVNYGDTMAYATRQRLHPN